VNESLIERSIEEEKRMAQVGLKNSGVSKVLGCRTMVVRSH